MRQPSSRSLSSASAPDGSRRQSGRGQLFAGWRGQAGGAGFIHRQRGVGARAVLLRASGVEVVVELMPLLEQQLHMRDARADNITVNLERGKNGERSWEFKQAAGNDVAPASRLDRLTVFNLALNYFAGGEALRTEIAEVSLNQIAGSTTEQNIALSGTLGGDYPGQRDPRQACAFRTAKGPLAPG